MNTKVYTLIDAKQANGYDRVAFAQDFQHAVFALNTVGTTTATIKFVGSIQEDAPDFSSLATAGNQWDYIQVVDLEDGTPIDGDTGIAYAAAAADSRQLEANVNGMRWVAAIISGYSGGTIETKVRVFNND